MDLIQADFAGAIRKFRKFFNSCETSNMVEKLLSYQNDKKVPVKTLTLVKTR